MAVAAVLTTAAGPVAAQQRSPPTTTVTQTTQLLHACTALAGYHDRLTGTNGKATTTQFASRSDANKLAAIAKELQALPRAKTVGTILSKAKAGAQRRRAVDKAYHWCDGKHAFRATNLTLKTLYEVVDVDPVVTGTSDAGATISIGEPRGASIRTTADANGAFSVAVPNVPFDTDVTVTVEARVPMREPTTSTAILYRTKSPQPT